MVVLLVSATLNVSPFLYLSTPAILYVFTSAEYFCNLETQFLTGRDEKTVICKKAVNRSSQELKSKSFSPSTTSSYPGQLVDQISALHIN